MLHQAAMRSVGLFHRWASPKNIGSISKYLYIRNLIDQYRIDKILDVGANAGQFANAMRNIGFKGDIYSFEPVSQQFEILKIASAIDTRWHVFNFALGSQACYQDIYVTKNSVFSSFNLPTTSETSMFANGNSVDRSEHVEVRRLDHFAQEHDIAGQLDHCFLKCDTQVMIFMSLKVRAL